MRPSEEEIRLLVAEWIRKADLDFKAAVRLSAEGEFRDGRSHSLHGPASRDMYISLTSSALKARS